MKLQNPLIDFNVNTINSGLSIVTVNLHENSFQLNFIDLSLNNPKKKRFVLNEIHMTFVLYHEFVFL